MEDFVHLHVHTYYSVLDGQSKIPNLVDKAIKNGMKGMAITDHGVMFGIKNSQITVLISIRSGRRMEKNLLNLSSAAKCM